MKGDKLLLLGALVLIAIVLMVVLWIIALIGGLDITDGCLYRYNVNGSKSTASSSSSLMNSVVLKANGNYTALSSDSSSGVVLDPNTYGKWLNTNLRVKEGQKVDLIVQGEVSLCKAYIPRYNLQQDSNLDVDEKLIEIPRVEDKSSAPINLIFDAKTDEWRNITQVFKNDYIVVAIHPDKKTTVGKSSVYNNFTKKVVNADCTEGKVAYSPICGRYSIWDSSSSYVDKCKYVSKCYECNCRKKCKGWNLLGWCIKGYKTVCDWCSCYENVMGSAPAPYRNDGKYTSPWSDNINDLFLNRMQDCRNNHIYVDGKWQNEKYFWFSADTATGLLYRFDSNEDPSNKKERGSTYNFSKIADDQSGLNPGADYRVIKDEVYTASDVAYLQYRTHDRDGTFGDNTGGYVLNIKQTKCRRKNGNSFNDTFEGRGNVQYIIGKYGENPNKDKESIIPSNLLLDANGSGSITASSNENGYLWLRINNDPNDYKDSFGQYRVDFMTSIEQGGFYHDVLDPFFQGFKSKIRGAAEQVFKNMTCYKGISGSGNCTNFFNYVKGLLSLYIMIYGMMFLLGMVQISQTDLVIRVVKIAFVAGLLNDSTFEFFSNYVFDFVTGFTDDIIANMSGYSIFSNSTSISNPFMFLNEVMTKAFLSSTFVAQILALLSMGINGVIYFIIVIACLGIAIITLLRSIAVYLMAFMAITVLIGLTPLFLTFVLFEKTYHLFDNWVKFMFRYMLEPVVLLAGIIILTQLFTIYLDFVIGYSVCWKCAIPIKIPFPNIPGVTPAFLDVEIFCLNWFAPWGVDHRSSQMGLNMQHMVVLLIIAYCMWGYIDLSGAMVARLAGSSGGPSATGMGKAMSGEIEQRALSQVGLDSKSIAKMKKQIKGRLKSMQSADKKMPIDKTNRHDIKPPSGSGSGKGGTGNYSKNKDNPPVTNNPGTENDSSNSNMNLGENLPESGNIDGSGSGGKSNWKSPSSSPSKTDSSAASSRNSSSSTLGSSSSKSSTTGASKASNNSTDKDQGSGVKKQGSESRSNPPSSSEPNQSNSKPDKNGSQAKNTKSSIRGKLFGSAGIKKTLNKLKFKRPGLKSSTKNSGGKASGPDSSSGKNSD